MLDSTTYTPFDRELNTAVLEIAEKLVGHFSVSDDAPSTYHQLKAHLDAGKTLVVAKAGSDNTIFGVPEVNYAYRAWHDWTHWLNGFDFSLCGECMTCNAQIQDMRAFYGVNEQTERWAKYLIADVIGQRLYYERYQSYVSDQRSFVLAYIADPTSTLLTKW